MSILGIILLVVFAVMSLFRLYLFGMQRAIILISRVKYMDVDDVWILIPRSYATVEFVSKILFYGVLAAILFVVDWKIAVVLFVVDYLLSAFIPIPYALYKETFLKKAKRIKEVDEQAGLFYENLLSTISFRYLK